MVALAYEDNPKYFAQVVCASAYQACARMLQAYWLLKGLSTDQTESFRDLCSQVREFLPGFDPLLPMLTEMDTNYEAYLYPMEPPVEVTADDARRALECVEHLFNLLSDKVEEVTKPKGEQ